MNKTHWMVLAAALIVPAACSHDRRESETPDQMTPASGYNPDQPAPNTTNQPSQPGSPAPMNLPTDTIPPEGQDTPAPDSRVSPAPGNTSTASLTDVQPAGGGTHGMGSGGKGGHTHGGSGGSSGSSGGAARSTM